MGSRLEGIREGGAWSERKRRDDHAADLRHHVPSRRSQAAFELGEAPECLVVLDAVEAQQHRRRGGSVVVTLPPQKRGPHLLIEIPRVLAQHVLTEGWMRHAGSMFWFRRN